ncbi:beta-phosphoglucomutase [Mycoplasma crocodyli]|uniref:Beta-phosphoglucomutase n=1 Tax=Mycoplasma crocodyli (strain ATCC 51981 / MP145) TaxID=512564 RepID=D5E6C2_MYCCM|nr:beta-phosphoglucomutase [Mycoplasma crocodyli]ADE20005.1 beta-phosphoglucomutase [Mycoplasma crocodyli MP145]
MIKGFVFDLDGVITDTAELHFRAWKEIVEKIGIHYTAKVNDKLKGLSRIDTIKAILEAYKKDNDYTEQEILEMAKVKNDFYKKLLESEINESFTLPNIKRIILDAKKNNIKLALASSSYNAPMILKKLNLEEYFDFIVYPGNIAEGKPAPDIFLAAARGIGAEPHECIGFEDAPAGLKGILDAGMHSVVVTHDSKDDFSEADLIVKTTLELTFDKIKKHFKF